jgi:hypothetical protein
MTRYEEDDALARIGDLLDDAPVQRVSHGHFAVYPDNMTIVETEWGSNKIKLYSEWSDVRTRTFKGPFTEEKVRKIAETARSMMKSPRGNPGNPRDRSTARKNWTMWNDKPEPRKEFAKAVKQLSDPYFVCVGKAEEILYSSDKWERDGDHHDYVHTFETRPGVYIPERAAGDEDVIGRPKKTLSILGMSASRKQLAVTEFAKVKDFTFKDKNGDLVEIALGRSAIGAFTPDKKCLIILAKNGPVLVRGGKMKVTARGIVN